jgi:Putative peptidoglycan binding domain/Transglycosylase SLT domain
MNIAFSRTLKLSSPLLRGNDVLALQTQLGIPLGQRDGVFGKATQQAVIAYQNRQQLTADGVVGRRTWASLFGTDSVTETPNADSTHVDSNAQLVIAASLKQFHNVYPDACKWRLTASGIEIEGKGIEISKGEPKTVSRVCQDYKDALEQAAKKTGVPVELLIATMCTEAFDATMHTVNPRATRKEPGYRSDEATPSRVSYGLTQTLISTARDAISQLAVGAPVSAEKIDREWLFIPANAILAGAAYIAMQKKRTKLDPPVVACAYNAGSVVYNNGANNRWKMRQYPIGTDDHADRFVQWFNDCFRYFKAEGCPFDPGTSFWQQLDAEATHVAATNAAPQSAETPLNLVVNES